MRKQPFDAVRWCKNGFGPKMVGFYTKNKTKGRFQRRLWSITECLYIPDLPSSHLRIRHAHAHFWAPPVARHTSQQTPRLMELLKQAKRIVHLSAKFPGPTVGALQMKVTARVRRLITPSTSRHTRDWTNLKCPLSGSKYSPGIKHTSNLNGPWKQFIRRDYWKKEMLPAQRDSDMRCLFPFSVNEQAQAWRSHRFWAAACSWQL